MDFEDSCLDDDLRQVRYEHYLSKWKNRVASVVAYINKKERYFC